jgi:hypothetical protein
LLTRFTVLNLSDRNTAPQMQTLEPIKKMVYNLMSDANLRKELKKHGLPTQGDRRAITSRLQRSANWILIVFWLSLMGWFLINNCFWYLTFWRYVTLHNAECDATNPRTQAEIRQQFEREEKANNISAPSSLVVSLKIVGVKNQTFPHVPLMPNRKTNFVPHLYC